MSSNPVTTPERARLREAISRAYRRDEPECVARLAAELRAAGTDPERVRARARALVEAVRHQRRGASGVDHLMQEFSLSSQEGVALMCLAEALLRIPDPATADRLIRDKISKGDWRAHLGASHSVFVNAATWGLMITGKLVSTHSEDALGGAVTRLIARGGEPLIRRGVDFAMRLLGKQFVMGETIEEALAADHELAGWSGLGFVVQAYQKRCPYVIDFIVELARRNARRIMVRLVKGAYWDAEIKRAQVEGHEDYPVFTRKVHTDLSYLACALRLIEAPDAIYPQFATHNAHTLATVHQMAADRGVDDHEFQCLHGMGEALYDNVVGVNQLGKPARIYAPVGTHETLLPYLVRRLLENGANSSFVNRIVDESVTVDQLIADPLEAVARDGAAPHPGIPLPRELYGASRANSAGLDLSDEIGLDLLERALDHLRARRWSAFPVIAGRAARRLPAIVIRNPANHADEVGDACEATVEEARDAVDVAVGFASQGDAGPREERAAMLDRAARLLETHRPELVSLAVREAGKTWPNAIAGGREGGGFCPSYAERVRLATDGAPPPGPAVCISPWNFPLAIFMGEVSAALAAGSPVIAKPAERTPLIRARPADLLRETASPALPLQLLPGRGETVGAALTADPRVRGVAFTGSTEVARLIDKSLGPRDARLIAETGGQKPMNGGSSPLAAHGGPEGL